MGGGPRRGTRRPGTSRVAASRNPNGTFLVTTTNSTESQPMTSPEQPTATTPPHTDAEAVKAVVRLNTEQVQGQGDFALFDELFADDFVRPHPPAGHYA